MNVTFLLVASLTILVGGCGSVSKLTYDNHNPEVRIRHFLSERQSDGTRTKFYVRVDSGVHRKQYFYSFYPDKIFRYSKDDRKTLQFANGANPTYKLSQMDSMVFRSTDTISNPVIRRYLSSRAGITGLQPIQ